MKACSEQLHDSIVLCQLMSEACFKIWSVQYTLCVCRAVEDSQDPVTQLEFRLPADALVPLPGSTPPPRPRPAAAQVSSDPFDAFGSAPATAAAARDDFADLESLGAIGAPRAQAVAGTLLCMSLHTPPCMPACILLALAHTAIVVCACMVFLL